MLLALLIAALVAVNIAYLLVMDRKDARASAERAERDAAALQERQLLLQRIQAPEQAVFEHATRAPAAAAAASSPTFDDDDEFWEAKELSREQLAMALAEREIADRGQAVI